MSQDFDSLPEPVRKAMMNGRLLDAAVLLRDATGISISDARGRVESALIKGLPLAQQAVTAPRQSPNHLSELAKGKSPSVIRLVQALRTGVANEEEKKVEPAAHNEVGSLAPGEQPHSSGAATAAWLLVAMTAAAALLFFRRS